MIGYIDYSHNIFQTLPKRDLCGLRSLQRYRCQGVNDKIGIGKKSLKFSSEFVGFGALNVNSTK